MDPPDGSSTVVGDDELIERTRAGDDDAFAELWRRHYRSGLVVARAVSSRHDPEDLVQEAYARVLAAIRKGAGPSGAFRAYLFTIIRNTATTWGRGKKDYSIELVEDIEAADSVEGAAGDAEDRALVSAAFRTLPARWQEALWYAEVEGMRPASLAPVLGITPAAVSQLLFRARQGLRDAWVRAHLPAAATGAECRWSLEHLGSYTRNSLGARDSARLRTHLAQCAECTRIGREAERVAAQLALTLLPAAVGTSAAAAYLGRLGAVDSTEALTSASPWMPAAAPAADGAGALTGVAGTPAATAAISSGKLIAGGLLAAATAALCVIAVVTPSTAPVAAPQPGTVVVSAPVDEQVRGTPSATASPSPSPSATPDPTSGAAPSPAPSPGASADRPALPASPRPTTEAMSAPRPPAEPSLPSGAPRVVDATSTTTSGTQAPPASTKNEDGGETGTGGGASFVLWFVPVIQGEPGATVQAAYNGEDLGDVTLDSAGRGSVAIRPEMSTWDTASLALRYRAESRVGPSAEYSTQEISDLID